MRNAVLNRMMLFINNDSYSKDELEKIHYGLEIIYIFITKGIIIFTISYLLGILKYTLTFFATYSILRSLACGLHATKSWICTLSSATIFIIIPYLCKLLIINNIVRIVIMIITTLLIFKYAPADTKKRPIINPKKRLFLKLASSSICIIYIISSFFIKENFILNAFMFSILLETMLILPTTYKLFKLPYNNYINYLEALKKEGGN